MIPVDLPCEEPAQAVEIRAASQDVLVGFGQLDAGRVKRADQALTERLSCAGEVLSETLIARVHLARGLAGWTAQAPGLAAAFGAARSADPNLVLATDLVPIGHVLRDRWDHTSTTEMVDVEVPRRTILWIDGRPGSSRARGRPAVVQLVDASDIVRSTVYLLPDEPLPVNNIDTSSWPSLLTHRPGVWTEQHFRPATAPLLASGAGMGLVAGATYAYSWVRRGAFDDRTVMRTEDELSQIRRQVNTADALASIGVGLALALEITGVATIRW